jgi:predicted RNA-binding Zn-ribbon protein involved in translation (DUF1610 family)
VKINCPNCGAKGTLRADVELPPPPGKKKEGEKGEAAEGKEEKPAKEEEGGEATTIDCPKCGAEIKVESKERPIKIKCPKCGAKGTLKDEGEGKKPAPPPEEEAEEKPSKEDEPAGEEGGDEATTIDCPCGGKIPVPSSKRPIKIECPKCGRKGTLKK